MDMKDYVTHLNDRADRWSDTTNRVRTTTVLDPDLRTEAETCATRNGQNLSAWIRQLVIQEVARKFIQEELR
ncbi:uncharacterized protein METZ01_LOCUS285984 [marine metagenome]|uniref:CopG family transcriptional regulator n=1 Tax=marine metagenome TaxID=408172 RepID=A0A382L8X0_9ZZZZ